MTKCWKPRCRRDATVRLSGDGWAIAACPGEHERTARYVLACPVVRGGQMALPLGGDL